MVDLEKTAYNQATVIGSMLIDEKTIGPTLADVQPEDFTDIPYRKIFLTIRKMFSEQRVIDPATVMDDVKADGTADWYALIQYCIVTTPSAANYQEYIRILREDARVLRVNRIGEKLMSCRDMDSAQELTAELQAGLVGRGKMKTTTMAQGLEDFFARHRTKESYLKWGFSELDEALYVSTGNFVILAGYASDGKTAMALSMALTQSVDKRVGFYSLETNDGTLMDRLVARAAMISMKKIKRSELDEEDYSSVAELSSELLSHKLEIVSASGYTVEDIFADAQSKRYEIIYIDYIQLIRGDKRFGGAEEIAGISKAIHTSAQSTGINVIGLSQFSRPDKSAKVRPAPTMSDLRGSGQLEQDADVIMLLYREEPEAANSRRVLKIAKNKEGEIGQMFLCFDGAIQRFRKSAIDAPAPKRRKESEYKQINFSDLPTDESVPFETGGAI